VRAVIEGSLSRHQAAAQFGIGISTAILWVQRFRTGSVKPDKIGGYRPKKIEGRHREWLGTKKRRSVPGDKDRNKLVRHVTAFAFSSPQDSAAKKNAASSESAGRSSFPS